MNKIDKRFIELNPTEPNALTAEDIMIDSTSSVNIGEQLVAGTTAYSQQDSAPTSLAQDSTAVVTHPSLSGKEAQAIFQVMELSTENIDQNTTDIIAYVDKDKWDLENVQGTVAQLNSVQFGAGSEYGSEDGTIKTGWTENYGGYITPDVSYLNADCLKFGTNQVAYGRIAGMKDYTAFGTRTVLTARMCMNINEGISYIYLYNGSAYCSIGLNIANNLTYYNSSGIWVSASADPLIFQEFTIITLDMDWTAQQLDVYQNGVLLAENLPAYYIQAGTNGRLTLDLQNGNNTSEEILHIDYMNIGSTLNDETCRFETAGDAAVSIGTYISAQADSDTKLLIQSNTTNGSQVFEDMSPSNHSITTNGGVSHSTSVTPQTGMGTSSIYFDGDADGLEVATSTDFGFGTGDFTVDFWLNAPGTSANSEYIYDTRDSGGTGNGGMLWIQSGKLYYYADSSNRITQSDTLSTSTWYHIALVRYSGTTTLYVGGVSKGSFSDSINYVTAKVLIGQRWQYTATSDIHAYIDEFRISKDIARWESAFSGSLPSAPYHILSDGTEPKIQAGCQFKLDSDSTIYTIQEIEGDGTDINALTITPAGATSTDVDWIHGNNIPETGANADKLSLCEGPISLFRDECESESTWSFIQELSGGTISQGTHDGEECILANGGGMDATFGQDVPGISDDQFTILTSFQRTSDASGPAWGSSMTFQLSGVHRICFQYNIPESANKFFYDAGAGNVEVGTNIAPMNTWLNIRLEVDMITHTFDFYLNDLLIESDLGMRADSTGPWHWRMQHQPGSAGAYNYFELIGNGVSSNQYYTATTNDSGQIDTSLWQTINSGTVTEIAAAADIDTIYYNDNATTFTGWADDDNNGGESTVEGNVFKFYTSSTGGDTWARRIKQIGASLIPSKFVTSIRVYHDKLGARDDSNYFLFTIDRNDAKILIEMCSDGLYIQDNSTWVNTGIYVPQGEWVTWSFEVDTSNPASATCNIYKNGVKVAINLSCIASGSSDGRVYLAQYGYTVPSCLTYVDWLRIGNELTFSGNYYSLSFDERETWKVFHEEIPAELNNASIADYDMNSDPGFDGIVAPDAATITYAESWQGELVTHMSTGTPVQGGCQLVDSNHGTFGSRTVISLRLWFTGLNTYSSGNYCYFQFNNGSYGFYGQFTSAGITLRYSGGNEQATGITSLSNGQWYDITFDITSWPTGEGNGDVDIWIDGVKEATAVSFGSSSGNANGYGGLVGYNYGAADVDIYVDHWTMGSGPVTQEDAIWRPIAKNDVGTWKYNNNTAVDGETWVASSNNTSQCAISEAIEAQEVNRHTGPDYAGVLDSEWEATGGYDSTTSTLDLAVTQTTSNISTPTCSNFDANYDLDGNYQMSTIGVDYKVERISDTTTQFKKLSAGTNNSVYCTVITDV